MNYDEEKQQLIENDNSPLLWRHPWLRIMTVWFVREQWSLPSDSAVALSGIAWE